MGSWGDLWPIEWGGGPTLVERVYAAIRSARGVGGSGPVGGIEDAWILSEAEAIAASHAAIERAALQAFGFAATDFLPLYEQLYQLDPAGTEQEQREHVAAFEAQDPRADVPSLEAELLALSPYLSLEIPTRPQSTITMQGKWLAPRDGLIPYGGRAGQDWANYADEFVLHGAYAAAIAHGLPDDSLVVATAKLLRERLPAWMDFRFHQLGSGFFADGGADGLSVSDFAAVAVP